MCLCIIVYRYAWFICMCFYSLYRWVCCIGVRKFRRAANPGPSGEREITSLQLGLPQHPDYPPMQSDSEERHHSDRNGDSPGNVQVSQCECLSLFLSLSLFIKWPQILFYMLCKLLSRFLMLHVYVWRSPSVKVDGHLPFIYMLDV